MTEKLDDTARESALKPLQDTGWDWLADRGAITKSFKFKDFTQAFGWMTRAALIAEKMDHDP